MGNFFSFRLQPTQCSKTLFLSIRPENRIVMGNLWRKILIGAWNLKKTKISKKHYISNGWFYAVKWTFRIPPCKNFRIWVTKGPRNTAWDKLANFTKIDILDFEPLQPLGKNNILEQFGILAILPIWKTTFHSNHCSVFPKINIL